MTIRPLKVEFRFAFNDYLICSHRDEIIGCIKKLPKDFIIKIKKYPITAFGYSFNLDKDLSNPKFDRTDVIKALDFWIEHWVYQNKKDYILEGTVNKDFELTVRELIETREAVLKMPVDTQFVRQKIRSIAEIQEIKPKMVEFTENVLQDGNTSASTVDQFCYVVRKMTYKEYMKRNSYHPADMRYDIFHIMLTNRTLNANENTIVDTVRERPPNALSTVNNNSSALTGKRISRIDIRFKKQGEPL